MIKILKPIALIIIGVITGLIIYNNLGVNDAAQRNIQDSSIVKTALAQNADDDTVVDESIPANRQNAITRAVAQVSPAVVSVNVTKLRVRVQRNPYVDPFFREFLK